MRSILTTRHLLLAATVTVLLAALFAGCAKQDLYEAPGSPYQIVGTLRLPTTVEGVAVIDHSAFIAGGEAGLYSVDWSDPTAPQLLMTVPGQRYSEDIEVVRVFTEGKMIDVAYLLDPSEGTLIYDVTDPNAVIYKSAITVAWGAHGIAVNRGNDLSASYDLFMADDWNGVRAWSVDPEYPFSPISTNYGIETNGKAFEIAARDGWGYVANSEMGLCVLDIDPIRSASLSSWGDTPGTARDVALEGNYAFIADGSEGLAVFRINAGDTPEHVAQYDLNGFSVAVTVRDGLCALAANGAGVHFLDVSRPSSPIYLGSTATSYATDVALAADGHCIVTDEDDGLLVMGGRGQFFDDTPPAPLTDLVIDPTGVNELDLSFTMTGDDGFQGIATALEVRQSAAPITDEASWIAATPVIDSPVLEDPGTPTIITMGGFDRNETYHFAARVIDDEDQVSSLSNPASGTTLDLLVLRNGRVTPLAGLPGTNFVFEVEVLWGLPLIDTEVVIDGVTHTMSPGDGRFYRYEIDDLEIGMHTYSFRFTGDTSPDALFPADGSTVSGPVGGAAAFIMGSPLGENGRSDDEVLHVVALMHNVIGSPYEVTQAEWDEVMDSAAYPNPSQHVGASRPVDSVTWLDAAVYCNARSAADGRTPAYAIAGNSVTWNHDADGWRLPTEAEWEYLARANSTTALYNGNLVGLGCQLDINLDEIGWYCGNSETGPQLVGQKEPNEFGLYDTSGNLREWCWDWYGELDATTVLDPEGPATGYLRVCRGGHWYYRSQDCRNAARGTFPPDSVDDTVGFRVVRTDFSR